MDAQLETLDAEVRQVAQCQNAAGKEEAVNDEQLPLLAAYRDDALCLQAAEQLVQMMEDKKAEAHQGEDLPKADRAALLRKASQLVG